MDYTEIKKLIFQLLKEAIPNDFSSDYAKFGEIHIFWIEKTFQSIDEEPFYKKRECSDTCIGIMYKALGDYITIKLTDREILDLKLILTDVYPIWVEERNKHIIQTLSAALPKSFSSVQEQIIND